MSMRPAIYPLTAVGPIRDAIGSRDQALVERMVVEYAKVQDVEPESPEAEEFRKRAQSFVQGQLRGAKEPGEWGECVRTGARCLGLLREEYAVNDDWKWAAWSDYHDKVASRLVADAEQKLRWLVEGRSLKAESVDADGTYYAWLESEEVERLHQALAALQVSEESLGELMEFHEELLEWLEACRGKTLLLIAS